MLWTLNYYPAQACASVPKELDDRKRDMGFLVSCDAECPECGYTQHPPTGGECPVCGFDGELDYENIQLIR